MLWQSPRNKQQSDEMLVLSDVPASSVARKPAVFGVRGSEFNLSCVLEQVQGLCASI